MELAAVVDAFGLAIDALGEVDGDGTDVSVLRSGLADLKKIESRLGAHLARLTHDADRKGAFVGTGSRDTAEWLGKQTGTSTRKNRTAAELGEAMARSDHLAEAVESGRLSTEQAAAAVGAAGGAAVDGDIIGKIEDLPPHAVRPIIDEWRAGNDEQRERDRAAQQRNRRYLLLTDVDGGMTRVDGLLDPQSAAIVRTTLDSIISESAFDESDRTRDQRRADSLTQLCKAASKGKITGGRSNARVLVTAPYDTVCEQGALPGRSHAGPSIDADAVRAMCCDAGMHRVITGPGSSILDFGHETRLVSDNLFLALVARDQHCRWPGCTLRGTWCDAHHLDEWQHGGRTAEDTCVLLCHHHHSLLHQPGWSIVGNAHRFEIHHPDGSVEVSEPPLAVGDVAPRSSSPGPSPGAPPGAPAPRADEIGRETSTADVLESLGRTVRQLALV